MLKLPHKAPSPTTILKLPLCSLPHTSREEARPTPSLNCHRGDIPLDANPPRHLHTFPPTPLPSMSYGKKDEDADLGLVKVDRSQVFQEGLSLAIA